MDYAIKFSDLAIIFATLLGPILAVQAQKWIERRNGLTNRRIVIFRTLMANRGTELAPANVEALNAVPIEFHGRNKNLKKIVEAWKIYLDHLSQPIVSGEIWYQKRRELLFDLIHPMSILLGYKFSRREIANDVYIPKMYGDVESENTIIRQGLANIFSGSKSIPLDIRSFPSDPTILANQIAIQTSLLEWLRGETVVKVNQPREP